MMNCQPQIERIYEHVETGAVDKAVFACVRLSRAIGDIFNLSIFLREVSADDKQFTSAFYDETRSLKKDAQKFLWKTSHEYWLAGRTLEGYPHGGDEKDEKKVLTPGVGELQREIEHFEQCLKDLQLPPGMGEFDTAAFTDRYAKRKGLIRDRLRANQTVLERIRTRCLDYASRVEKQLAAQAANVHFLEEVQSSVNNFFAARSADAYTKLMKATELAQKTDAEDQALLLTSVRRALKSVADCLYPPIQDEVLCQDGKSRKMGEEQYLNRLHEFCMRILSGSTADEMIKAEIEYLAAFMRRLNELASKGVHSDVSRSEAKQGLIGVYLFLSNIVNRMEMETSNKTDSGDA